MKKTVVITLLLIFIFYLSGCDDTKSASPILDDLLEVAEADGGLYYYGRAYEWEAEYLSEETKLALFSNYKGECEFDRLVEDYAIYLSASQEGGEVMVLVCYDNGDAREAARMCHYRVDLADQVSPELADSAVVYVNGRYVVLAMLGDKLDINDIRDVMG